LPLSHKLPTVLRLFLVQAVNIPDEELEIREESLIKEMHRLFEEPKQEPVKSIRRSFLFAITLG